ncbi:serine protease 53-like [Uranotaenia lowii]|uniref:serine protease 53-like n=1 Tax=Uranotaenia lowii TaxID=190385 RepID=UPI0024796100|nr:serine protease 53-like [Uranotaenia lowii]
MLAVSLLASLFVGSSVAEEFPCGVPKVQHQATIKGGSSVNHGEWPWHAAIYHKEGRSYSYACGGTLISEEFVLTAAHCLFNENTYQLMNRKRISVRLGVHNLDEINSVTSKEFPVQTMHLYANFSRESLQNDIAILELAEVARFTNFILPACLTTEATSSQGTSIGWGLTDNDEISPILKKADLPIIDSVNCLISDRDYFGHTIDRGMFCAGHKNGTTVCNGDSGGGLFVKHRNSWHLMGIVSFIKKRPDTTNFCATDSYAGFTNVTDYIPWIKNITNVQVKDKTASFCGQRKQIKRYSIGAEDQTETELVYNWPWHGALYRRDSESVRYLCGITILAKKTVITAGFCIEPKKPWKPSDFFIRIGLTEDIFGKVRFSQELDVSKVIVRENGPTLLQLYSDIVFSEYIQPICLWKGDTGLDKIAHKTGQLITWKFDKDSNPVSSEQAMFKIIPTVDCLTQYPAYSRRWKDAQFCALYQNGSATEGSGGAGLFMLENNQWMIRGILSYGIQFDVTSPHVFTDVASYLTAERLQARN